MSDEEDLINNSVSRVTFDFLDSLSAMLLSSNFNSSCSIKYERR